LPEALLKKAEMAEMDREGAADREAYMAFQKVKFNAADRNKDGSLDANEMPVMMNPELHDDVLTLVAEHEFKIKDTDKDGVLSKKEFFATDDESEEDGDKVIEFDQLDKDKSGTINFTEFKHHHSGEHHTELALQKILELADKDKDGHVTFDEFTGAPEMHDDEAVTSHLMEWAEGHTAHGGEL